MPQTNTNSITALLTERVRKIAEEGLEKKTVTYSKIEKIAPDDVNSRTYFLPFTPFDNESEEWAASENFDYAPSDAQTHIRMAVSYTRVSATCSFSNDVRQMDRDPDTIFRVVGQEVARKTAKLRKRLNQYSCNDGSGELGRVSAISTVTITFNTTGNLYGVWKFGVGQRIQWWNPALSTQRVGGGVSVSTVVSIDKANKQVVFDAVPSDLSTASTGDVATVVGGANNVIRGWQYHLANSGTYQTKSRATYSSLNATIISASSAPLSASLMSQLKHTMIFKVEQGDPNGRMSSDGFVWMFPPEQCHAYEILGYDLRILDSSLMGKDFDLGLRGQAFDGSPIFEEVDATPNQVAFINFKWMGRVQLKALSPEPFPGGDIFWPRNANSGNGHQDGVNVYLTAKMDTFSSDPKELGGLLTTLQTAGFASRHTA